MEEVGVGWSRVEKLARQARRRLARKEGGGGVEERMLRDEEERGVRR